MAESCSVPSNILISVEQIDRQHWQNSLLCNGRDEITYIQDVNETTLDIEWYVKLNIRQERMSSSL